MFYMKIDFDAQCLKDIFISDALKGNFKKSFVPYIFTQHYF